MKLEGELKSIDLIAHLMELAEERFTGAIRFEHDGIIKILYFKGGDVLSASTNDRTDSVDEILLRAGKINRDHIREALGKRRENETLGDALLTLGFVSKTELTSARRLQAVGIIRSVRAWREGSFQVVQDYLPKREEGIPFYLPQLILELIVTEPDRSGVEAAIQAGEVTFSRTDRFSDRYAGLALNEDADAITSQIDGERTASEIAERTGLDSFAVYKLLVALEILGLIERPNVKVTPEVLPLSPDDPLLSAEGPFLSDPLSSQPAGPDSFALAELDPEPFETFSEADAPLDRELEIEPAVIPPDDAEVGRRAGRNSLLFLGLLAVVLLAGSFFGYRWWASTGALDPEAAPAITTPAEALPVPAPESEFGLEASQLAESDAPVEATATAETVTTPAEIAPAPEPDADVPPVDPLRERYFAMAREYAQENRTVAYTLQFEIVCQTASVTKAIAEGERVWFVPIQFRGEPCFRVFWGRYATREAAQAAAGEIPQSLRGTDPVVVQPRELLR
ncbi:MAG TPA: DUF4388 domain-containing protein [Thermoanaerobaculia bacterium]|nr:DUF4388 domain-containing protein [Thermoanaerobaculia bacterium]